jgi:transcriptional regulator with XRE-family HTH domain
MKQNYKPSALRLARVLAGLSQRDVADQVNRSPVYIHRLETGGSAVLTPELASKIADTLGSTPEILFEDEQ